MGAAGRRAAALQRGAPARSRIAASSSGRAPFFRGGIWQSFLAKYPEAEHLHKKMVWVSDKLARAEREAGHPSTRRARARSRARELYRAQCNCAYWHGLFGGLYLNYLRDAVYRHLIEAEVARRARCSGTGDKPLVVEASTSTPICRPRWSCRTPSWRRT